MKHYYQDIEGWFDFQDIYDKAIEQAEDGDILVETGSWHGKSAVYLGVEAYNSGKDLRIFTIDCNEQRAEIVKENIKPLNNVTYLHGSSLKLHGMFGDGVCRMVFLDADHDALFIRRELRLWMPKVKQGGIFAGHDYHSGYPGLVKEVNNYSAELGRKVEAVNASWLMT